MRGSLLIHGLVLAFALGCGGAGGGKSSTSKPDASDAAAADDAAPAEDAPAPTDGSACTPTTCEAQSKNCGIIADACGGFLECGDCVGELTCGGGGLPNVCGLGSCVPSTCESVGAQCGSIPDGCGATVDCGGCPDDEVCGVPGNPNACIGGGCVPKTCAQLGVQCGPAPDGCGGQLECGGCDADQACAEGQCVAVGGCPVGAISCAENGAGFHACGLDADDEWAFGGYIPCQLGDTCADGRCSHEQCLQAEVIVLLDRSSSMLMGDTWTWVKSTVLLEIDRRDSDNLFGFRQFPSGEACSVGEVLPLAKNAHNQIASSIDTPEATSATPITMALSDLEDKLGDPNDGQAVLLITDGDETCDTQDSAVDAAAALHYKGIPVHVVAVTTTANQMFLDGLAKAGGTGESHLVTGTEELRAALRDVFETIGACEKCVDLGCKDDVLRYCEDGFVSTLECASLSATCGAGASGKECLVAEGAPCPGGDAPASCGPSAPSCFMGECCAPQCNAKACGDDGCGGSCGTCQFGSCVGGQCDCTPACAGKECGPDGCGADCGSCTFGACVAGQCECTPSCAGKDCGSDGCGATCGTCEGGNQCVSGLCGVPCGGAGTAPAIGCCKDGDLYFCYQGLTYTEDCSNKPFCGLSSETLQYQCGTLGIGDPTGIFPKDCPF